MGENNLSDGSASDGSDVARLFNKVAAKVKAGMAAPSSSDEDSDDNSGIQLYYDGGGANNKNRRENEAKIRRAARDRKRRAAETNIDSDDEDDVAFVPKSQSKKTPVRGRGGDVEQERGREVISLLNETGTDSSDEDGSQEAAKFTTVLTDGVLNPETSRQLRAMRNAQRRTDATTTTTSTTRTTTSAAHQHRSPVDVDDEEHSMHRWVTVNIDGTQDTATFSLEESNSIKDVIVKCTERFKIDKDTPIGLYLDNRVLANSDLLFSVPIQCTMVAKVHRKLHNGGVKKDAPKGTMMRFTLRGPKGDKEVRIGSLQPLQIALDQYGAGNGLRFDGDRLKLDRPPGDYELEDEDLIDVV